MSHRGKIRYPAASIGYLLMCEQEKKMRTNMTIKTLIKAIAVFSMTFATQAALANSSGIWADGVVTYPHPSGHLVNRECQLWVPAMGQGEVTLKCGEWSMSSAEFSTQRHHGKVTFSVIFRNVPGAPEGTAALYSGPYMRGSNRAIYYGDVSSGSGESLTFESPEWNYVGGFMFKKEITQTATEE